jgi:predicted signal transduction protein with EAL and GGDEF domain
MNAANIAGGPTWASDHSRCHGAGKQSRHGHDRRRVETQQELDYLKSQGCTEAQGYFFSKPKPASEVYKMLGNRAVIAKFAA